MIIGCDVYLHHTSWGSTNINKTGASLFNYIMANRPDTMNRDNRPTFVTSNTQKVIDIMIAPYMLAILLTLSLRTESLCSAASQATSPSAL